MKKKKCIACSEVILAEAKLCKHCRTLQDSPQFGLAEINSDLTTNSPKKQFRLSRLKIFTLVTIPVLIGVGFLSFYTFVSLPTERAKKADAEASAQAWLDQREEEKKRQEEMQIRLDAVEQIQTSVETLAAKHIKQGVISGKVINTTCTPVSGYSLDNLDQSSTIFDCFVSTKDNGDGTTTGFSYTAVMDWQAGSFTYKLGDPN